jgi:hypothetical protein
MVLLADVVYLHNRLRNKLRIIFGIQWDRQATPYCPSSDKPLTMYGPEQVYGHPGFWCVKCKNPLSIRNEQGEYLTLPQAKEYIKST